MEQEFCAFCDPDLIELPTAIKICDLKYARLYLFREQIYPGRCLLATKTHAAEIYDLPPAVQEGFLSELAVVSKTLQQLYHADKMNFLSLGDTVGHIHIHIVPKRKSDPDWGGMFRFMEKDGYLSEGEYQNEIKKIGTALKPFCMYE